MLHRVLDAIVRAESGRVLAQLIRTFRDIDLAEDLFQEAVQAALETWPRDGLPRSPGAWLTATARRRGLDQLRHRAVVRRKRQAVLDTQPPSVLPPLDADDALSETLPDERLRLMFTCCHPALALESQVALTLRTLGGLTTREIAWAFQVPESTMAQRLVRAKGKIRDARIPYRIPDAEQLAPRLEGVLAVIYLIFNEGYLASSGASLMRRELSQEAIRLGRVLAELMPEEPEVLGLLALMLLHDARAPARYDASGVLVELERQDRGRWRRPQIVEGAALVERALRMRSVGPYQLQAAISALHSEAPSPEATDWLQIALLYDLLFELTPTDSVELNRIIAWAMVKGPSHGLDALDRRPRDDQPWVLARADFLLRLGRLADADRAFARAERLTENEPVRAFIRRRRAELKERGGSVSQVAGERARSFDKNAEQPGSG